MEQSGKIDLRIILNKDKSYALQVMRENTLSGPVNALEQREKLLPLPHSFEPGSNYGICNGLKMQTEETNSDCQRWIEKSSSVCGQTKSENLGMCRPCVLYNYAEARSAKRKAKFTIPDKLSRTKAASHCTYRYLSPK